MRELSLRTLRFQCRMRFWKYAVSTAMTGTISSTSSASFQLRISMDTMEPAT